ncbi:MAG TPA: hypothetical protein VGL56_04925 [Fimbriimonadaceae bacterium]|jgi:hypothetical protein
MRKLLIAFVLVLGACAPMVAHGQTDTEKEAALTKFKAKLHDLEVYNMVLPILMTKDQLKTILKTLQKCRARAHDLLTVQYKAMLTLESKVDDAISAAADKGAVPSPAIISSLYSSSMVAVALRANLLDDDVDDMYDVITKTLNKGQLQAMANSLNPKEFPELLKKPDEVKQEDRIRIYIRAVLLDDGAYPLLVKMSL